jgi:hypothetical protein
MAIFQYLGSDRNDRELAGYRPHINGIEEVVGSIPSGSTKPFNKLSSYLVDVVFAFVLKSPPRRHRPPSSGL